MTGTGLSAGVSSSILSSFGLASVVTDAFSETERAAEAVPFSSICCCCFGAAQVGTVHWMPVNDFSWKPALVHRLHGLPLRSSARSLSLIAPVFAFGPSLEPATERRLAGALGSLLAGQLRFVKGSGGGERTASPSCGRALAARHRRFLSALRQAWARARPCVSCPG